MVKNNFEIVFKRLGKFHQPTMLELLSEYSAFQRLIATLLSSRTKDTTTIPIVLWMFKKYKTPQDFLQVEIEFLEKELYGIGFYKVKARNIHKLSKIIVDKFQGEVPADLVNLISLPGVGRKTANCMLAYVFNKPAIAVDVHVHRISNRLGWVKTKTPEETEIELMKILPKKLWNKVNLLLVDYGQRVCLPVKPKCKECVILQNCKFGRNVK